MKKMKKKKKTNIIKNVKSQLDQAEEQVWIIKYRSFGIIQSEGHKRMKKKKFKNEQPYMSYGKPLSEKYTQRQGKRGRRVIQGNNG